MWPLETRENPIRVYVPGKAVSPMNPLLYNRRPQVQLRRLGDLGFEVDPTLALLGIGFLLAAVYLLGGKAEPKRRKRKREAVQQKIEKLRAELKEMQGAA